MPDKPTAGPDAGHAERDASRTTSLEALISHFTLLWESERENAERLSRRSELVGGAIIALLGLGFFSVNWLYEVPSASLLAMPALTVVLLNALLTGVLVFFSTGLFVLYGSRKTMRTATEMLEIAPADLGQPIRKLLIRRLSQAYHYLKLRNQEVRGRLA